MVEPINNVFHRKFLWLTQAIVTRQDTLRFCDFFFFFFFLSRYQVRAQLQSTLNYFNFSSVIRMFGEGHPLSRYAELLLIVLIRCIIGSKSLPPGYGLWAHTHTHTVSAAWIGRIRGKKSWMGDKRESDSSGRALQKRKSPSITIFNYLERSLSSFLSILRYPVRSLFFIAVFKLD